MQTRSWLRRVWDFIVRENLHRLLFLLVIVLAFSTLGITWFEPEMNLVNGLWWSIVTLTTVGYGDIAPATLGGRLVAVVIMFIGIGLLGMLSATIASILVDKKIKEDRGMAAFSLRDHIILCEWNQRARVILDELRADPHTAQAPIVLIACLEHKPVSDNDLHFIQGDVTDETLGRANLKQASTVILLGDDRLDATARDAKVVLNALTVESLNPNVYTIAELVDEAHVPHCRRANANEIIVSSELSSGLIARAALNHGITQFVSDLLSARAGNELYKVPVPASLAGRRFIDALVEMKQKHQSILVAVHDGSQVLSNPPADHVLSERDHLIVIALDRPKL